jgi:phage tail tape-measure protein
MENWGEVLRKQLQRTSPARGGISGKCFSLKKFAPAKLSAALRKGKVARRKLKLKVQQLEKTNEGLVNASVCMRCLYSM